VAWRRRARRDREPLAPSGEAPAGATPLGAFDAFYVATTKHEQPLERIAAPGLGFRSRAAVTVTDRGLALRLAGQDPIFLAPERLSDVGQSTVTIDRVVEAGGLTRLTWRTNAGGLVDTYLRPLDASAKTLADAIRPLVPAPATGTDA
ncbi:MAG: hypothetical protein QM611_09455, partial [Microbacterium sp.]|uniref:PH-like domain-containing protein n=1 Tax=Microbacterium sp. TaxID=51671 RepID=UPI0039E44266